MLILTCDANSGVLVPTNSNGASASDMLSAEDFLHLEFFGVMVLEVLKVFQDEVKSKIKKQSQTFNLAFWVGRRDFVKPILDRDDEGTLDGKPSFVLNMEYLKYHLGGSQDQPFPRRIRKTLSILKVLALREVLFIIHGPQEGSDAIDTLHCSLFRLEEALSFSDWSWFYLYKERVEKYLMAEIQDTRSKPNDLLEVRKHVAAMQKPEMDSETSRDMLQLEVTRLQEEVRTLEADTVGGGLGDVMPNPAADLPTMDPFDLRFTQDTCKAKFRCNRKLSVTARQLRDGEIDVFINIPIIHVFEWEGRWHSLDNRRLEAFRQAGLRKVPIKKVPVSRADRNKFTTKNEGQSIKVR